ncbi:MAG: hypothetical protein KDB53_20015, partial [Planctomycetes bacterium]|nr:hypothetical protein [Planctomycetota bacterium]
MISRHSKQEGSLLVAVPVALLLSVGLVVATLTMSTTNLDDSYRETRRVRAYYVAKAGLEQSVHDLKEATQTAGLVNVFARIEALNDQRVYQDCQRLAPGGLPVADPTTGLPVDARALLAQDGVSLGGTFDVSMHVEGYDPANPNALGNTRRFVTIRSTGWVPSRNAPGAASHTIETTVMVELSASEVFDYAYFINNWGWFYGNSIVANGNVRSNGQFDAGNYRPTINGSPRFLGANGLDLYGYLDDNEDGVRDGSDGGIYTGWGINAPKARGMVDVKVDGDYVNQHDYDGHVEMPNLSDLTIYENFAKSSGASISVGTTQVCDAVCGDDVGERQNLYLEGTAADPIVINGTIVVRGDVIIKGPVMGQGVIYAGGNVYIADDITYVNPPATTRPSGNSEAEFETWMATNQSADSLGLFAREHVVLGDFTDSTWQSYVNSWMNDPLNKSVEDAGEDKIPNTLDGLDGIAGTSDDDVLEGNNNFDVEVYTAIHDALGLIPPGKTIGDVVPGSGED